MEKLFDQKGYIVTIDLQVDREEFKGQFNQMADEWLKAGKGIQVVRLLGKEKKRDPNGILALLFESEAAWKAALNTDEVRWWGTVVMSYLRKHAKSLSLPKSGVENVVPTGFMVVATRSLL
jgi:hypothetical protein